MRRQEIIDKLHELNENLRPNDCCTEIIPVIKRSKSDILPQIKLYKDIQDARLETNNFEWHLLDEILDLNNNIARNTHIVCNPSEEGCIVSLIVRKYNNEHNSRTTMFSKINKLEIIYI